MDEIEGTAQQQARFVQAVTGQHRVLPAERCDAVSGSERQYHCILAAHADEHHRWLNHAPERGAEKGFYDFVEPLGILDSDLPPE